MGISKGTDPVRRDIALFFMIDDGCTGGLGPVPSSNSSGASRRRMCHSTWQTSMHNSTCVRTRPAVRWNTGPVPSGRRFQAVEAPFHGVQALIRPYCVQRSVHPVFGRLREPDRTIALIQSSPADFISSWTRALVSMSPSRQPSRRREDGGRGVPVQGEFDIHENM